MIDTVSNYKINVIGTVWVLSHEYESIMGVNYNGIDGVFDNDIAAEKAKKIYEEDKPSWHFYITESKLIENILVIMKVNEILIEADKHISKMHIYPEWVEWCEKSVYAKLSGEKFTEAEPKVHIDKTDYDYTDMCNAFLSGYRLCKKEYNIK